MALAERRRQTVHRCRLMSAVLAVVVLHRRSATGAARPTAETSTPRTILFMSATPFSSGSNPNERPPVPPTNLQLFPFRPPRASGRGRTRLPIQGHAWCGSRLDFHVVRLITAYLYTPRALPPSASRALSICHSVYSYAHGLLLCFRDQIALIDEQALRNSSMTGR